MQRITDTRDANTPDEIWLLEHPPVFTLGLNADASHVLAAGDIPVVKIDRGGQVTYHGPGQLVVYPLIDIRRAGLGVRDLVTALERAVIDYCASLGITAECRKNAPGVYVDGRKIASVGLRIRRGASYHGLAFNVNMDLEPFQRINPCGYAGLQMTQLAALGHAGRERRVRGPARSCRSSSARWRSCAPNADRARPARRRPMKKRVARFFAPLCLARIPAAAAGAGSRSRRRARGHRPAAEGRTRRHRPHRLSGKCNKDVFRIADVASDPLKVEVLRADLARQLGLAGDGKTLTVLNWSIYYNKQARAVAVPSSATSASRATRSPARRKRSSRAASARARSRPAAGTRPAK